VEKRPLEFEIDMIRCIYCGMCEEVCPEQAIFLRKTTSSRAAPARIWSTIKKGSMKSAVSHRPRQQME